MARKMMGLHHGPISTTFPDRVQPTILSVSPSSGPTAGGTSVRVTMSRVNVGVAITVGGAAATITGASYGDNGYVDITTPAGTAGAKNVGASDPDNAEGFLVDGFTYTQAALTAGTSSAAGGDTVVLLSATAPTGGTSPYTYQWYRSTTQGQKGASLGASFQDLTETDTGRTNGTTYYYTLDATDSAGSPATVSYTQISATPNTAGSNEPASMTVLVNQQGTTRDFGTSWFKGAKWTNDTYTDVIADATNPTGSGSVIRKRWYIGDPGDNGNGLTELGSWSMSPKPTTVYHRLRWKYSSNWDTAANAVCKLGYFGYHMSGSPTQFWIKCPAGTSNNHVYFYEQLGSFDPNAIGFGSGSNTGQVNTWHCLELVITAQSARNVADGTVKVWLDGELQINKTGLNFVDADDPAVTSMAFDGCQLFLIRGAVGYTFNRDDALYIGEYYWSGKV